MHATMHIVWQIPPSLPPQECCCLRTLQCMSTIVVTKQLHFCIYLRTAVNEATVISQVLELLTIPPFFDHPITVTICIAMYPAVDWVGSCQHTAPSVEFCMNARLSNCNSALFHDFVDSSAVHVAHLCVDKGRE